MKNSHLLAVARIYDENGKHLDTEELIADLDTLEWEDNSGWYNYGAEVYDDTVSDLYGRNALFRSEIEKLGSLPMGTTTLAKFKVETEYEDPDDDEWYPRTVDVTVFVTQFN